MKHILIYMKAAVAALVLCLATQSCTDEPHDGGRGLAVELDLSACPEATISEVTVSITADDGSYQTSQTFADTKTLAASLFRVPPECYTVKATTTSGLGGRGA